jgi:hypothetical protein
MSESASDRAAAIETIAPAVEPLEPAAQEAAINAVVPGPDTATTGILWRRLVTGLLLLLVIASGGVLYLLVDDKSPDVALTMFTALLTGLLGLFAPSPVKGGGG